MDRFDLEDFLPYRLNRAAEFIAVRFAASYRATYGLTRPEWRTLAALGAGRPMTATEVGAHGAMHKTKVSRAVSSLEERRWLKRRGDPLDRRIEHLELTASGQKAYRELTNLAAAYSSHLAETLGEAPIAALLSGLTAIEAIMAERGAAHERDGK